MILHSDGRRCKPYQCFMNWGRQSHKIVSISKTTSSEELRRVADSNRRPSAYQLGALPLPQTASHWPESTFTLITDVCIIQTTNTPVQSRLWLAPQIPLLLCVGYTRFLLQRGKHYSHRNLVPRLIPEHHHQYIQQQKRKEKRNTTTEPYSDAVGSNFILLSTFGL